MRYKILKQNLTDNRTFTLEDVYGNKYEVDIYTDGKLIPPEGADDTDETWQAWLGSFVGKEISIDRIVPYRYFSGGDTYIINQ